MTFNLLLQKSPTIDDVLLNTEGATRDIFKNFAIFTGKHLRLSLFLIKMQTLRPASLLKRDYTTGLFPMNISFKNTYIKTYQRTAASEILEAL